MVSFKGKLISRSERLGDVLRAYREARNMSIRDVAARLQLATHFIDWIEAGKYHKMPGEVYTKNFIKRYAELVGINVTDALAQYTKEKPVRCEDHTPLTFKKRIAAWWYPRIVRRVGAIVVLFIVMVYIGWQAHSVFSAPPLVIENPIEGFVSKESSIQLAGHSLPETKIQINGREMITDTAGHFAESIDLVPGMNTVTITAIKKHGARTVAVRNIVLEQALSIAPQGDSIH